jgi:hypothetical protein
MEIENNKKGITELAYFIIGVLPLAWYYLIIMAAALFIYNWYIKTCNTTIKKQK